MESTSYSCSTVFNRFICCNRPLQLSYPSRKSNFCRPSLMISKDDVEDLQAGRKCLSGAVKLALESNTII